MSKIPKPKENLCAICEKPFVLEKKKGRHTKYCNKCTPFVMEFRRNYQNSRIGTKKDYMPLKTFVLKRREGIPYKQLIKETVW